ncbi:aldehyde dehydrogenase family protein [Faecalicatena contorta]|uniref:aldehyde dehydrogenase family protein n=1 Tax=Faecalicatena contorta TaxID=39482 RepID=UPI001F42C567|nr:aldehyde dehydrogenase family protein [Faecalicatena contorta]MCF2681511.1 aldehyde dehydrogenase family protein [Faecalicatena contorta]
MEAKEYVLDLIQKGRAAQQVFEKFSQEDVDKAVRAIGKIIYDNGEMLAKMAVEETRMGVYEDKIKKNKGKAKAVWAKLKGVKSRGIIEYDDAEGIVKVAKPIGVIGVVSPTTNPTMTPMQNAMIALKGGNAIIVGPHPRAKKTGVETVNLMRQALKEVGAPEDLIQIVPEPTVEISGLLMSECDACISTGGPGMVKAAYSSGKPAFGVGAGNVQTLVDRDADIADVADKVVVSRIYDNGVLCTCEQCVHVPAEKFDELVGEIVKRGAHYISEPADVDALRKGMFPTGAINKDVVGASPAFIAKTAGLECPEDAKLLLVKIEKYGADEYLAKEKLCPVLAIRPYDTWEEAVDVAVTNLKNEGAGHSAVVHSNTKEHVEYAAELLPVSRVGVNMIGSSGLGGGLDNGLNPTATLGCGTWGNNSISENLWWHNLVNIARVAYRLPDRPIPTDEEIWAE